MTEKAQHRLQPAWIAPNRTALVLIDMQVDFGSPDGEMARRGADVGACQPAVAKAVQLTDAARAAGVPAVFVRLLTPPGGRIVAATPRLGLYGPGPAPSLPNDN